ncbi:MAG: FHA domain-containing protein [Pseudomonadota bacterium]
MWGTLLVETAGGPPVRYRLDAPSISIGRGPENDVVLLDLKVSRRHALVRCETSGVVIEDLGSQNGFKHNRRRVRQATLQGGDILTIGGTRLRYFAADHDVQQENTAVTAMGEPLDQTLTDHSVARLVISLHGATRALPLRGVRATIGRSSKADVVLEDTNVSRIHAILEREGEAWVLVDQGSSNGTFVDGRAVQRCELQSGMSVTIGDATLVLQPPFDDDDLSVVATVIGARASTASERPGSGVVASLERPSIERVVERSGDVAPQAVPRRAPLRELARGRQPVVVVPGFMGSTLYDGDVLVWPDVKRFLKKPEFLKLPESLGLEPRGLVSEVIVVPGLVKLDAYNRLVEYLRDALLYEEGINLFSFAYDWRRDLRHAARQLGECIAQWQEHADLSHGKFVLVAHSAGGLVARYYIERMGGRHHVDRLILMGSPNRGTLKTLAAMLTGLGLMSFGARKERLRDVMGTFPAAYQLLPTEPQVFEADGRPIDLFADRRWVPDEVLPLLDDARAFLSEVGARSRVPVVSIFGYGHKTITRITVQRDRDGRFISPRFDESEHGDGTVTQTSAVLEGSEIHPVHQHHGALYTDGDVKMRLRLELLGQP